VEVGGNVDLPVGEGVVLPMLDGMGCTKVEVYWHVQIIMLRPASLEVVAFRRVAGLARIGLVKVVSFFFTLTTITQNQTSKLQRRFTFTNLFSTPMGPV